VLFRSGIDALERAVAHVADHFGTDIRSVSVGAVPLLKLLGIVAGGWQLARAASVASAHIAAGRGDAFYRGKLVTARFYADHVLSQAPGLAHAVVEGAAGALELADENF
jgi:acyl-CoA dehydrogenase